MRQSISFSNNTHYFDVSRSKSFISIPNPDTYSSQQSRVESYEVRLYHMWLETTAKNGWTFFYTLTYNDSHLPRFLGQVCFNYEDVRYIVNGAFSKRLERDYGYNLKYFISCESGEGKGKRGFGNNPHYHCLFFLLPIVGASVDDSLTGFSAEKFRSLLRTYWQGLDVDCNDNSADPRNFTFGICQEGEQLGVVSDFRAVTYVCKYVVKDQKRKLLDCSISTLIEEKVKSEFLNDLDRYEAFLCEYFGESFFKSLSPERQFDYIVSIKDDPVWTMEYLRFYESDMLERRSDLLRYYRNVHSGKVRISDGVGKSALDKIQIVNGSPVIQMPSKKGYKFKPIGTYLYRLKYTDRIKDPHTGNVVYVLNDEGLKLRLSSLPNKIADLSDKASSLLRRMRYDKMLYDSVKVYVDDMGDDYPIPVPDFEHFGKLVDRLSSSDLFDSDFYKFVSDKYSQYKLVYENHYFACMDADRCSYVPRLDFMADAKRFLSNTREDVPYSSVPLSRSAFVYNGYFSYSEHPFFSKYTYLFILLDYFFDVMATWKDDKRREEAAKRQASKNLVNSLMFNF